jgi:hypothetical protein
MLNFIIFLILHYTKYIIVRLINDELQINQSYNLNNRKKSNELNKLFVFLKCQ